MNIVLYSKKITRVIYILRKGNQLLRIFRGRLWLPRAALWGMFILEPATDAKSCPLTPKPCDMVPPIIKSLLFPVAAELGMAPG